MDGMAGRRRTVLGSGSAFAGLPDLVVEAYPDRGHQRRAGPNLDVVVIARRPAVVAVRLDDRQRHAVALHLAVTPAGFPQPLGPSDLEPDEVVGVVDDAHAVG